MAIPKRKRVAAVPADHAQRRIGRAAAAAGAPPPEPAQSDAPVAPATPERDLGDAKTQYEILNPETPLFTIAIDGVDAKIAVPTKFTLREIQHLRIHDDIAALNELINVELLKMIGPDGFGETLKANPRYYDVVLSRGIVRAAVRDLIAKAAYFVDPDSTGDGGKSKRRPTVDQIGSGMDGKIVSAIAVMLIMNYLQEVRDQKNGPTA